ncbi:hypothetical protein ACWEKM_21740 [Streptomyces sp. NPDC004752]
MVPCPVCLHPGRGERRCRACGFLLNGDPVLGAATEEDHRSAAAELAAAAHAWDFDAARRTLSDPAERGEIDGLLRPAPSGIPHPGPVAPPAPEAAADPHALADLLHRLTTGELPEVLFVEFGTQRATVVRAGADAAGLPYARSQAEASWTDVVPGLAPAGALRRFQLGGGVGTVEPVDRLRFDRAVCDWLHTVMPLARAGTGPRPPAVVLLRGDPGWTLLDRAAAVLHESCAVSAESATEAAPGSGTASATTARVRRLLRGAPLRRPHTLLLARAGAPAGDYVRVELHHHVLFEAGLRLAPGETRTASVTVYGGPPVLPRRPTAGGPAAPAETLPVVLPLLAGHYRPEDRQPPLIRMPGVELPVLGSARLTFVLHGPGEIEVRTEDGRILDEAPDGHAPSPCAVIPRVPQCLWLPGPLELICAVEMSGTDRAEVAGRVGFTRDLIRAAERYAGAGGGLRRVAVIGYYDHDPRNKHQPDRTFIRSVQPGPPGRALQQLRELPLEVLPRDTLTSSLEDALRAAARMTDGQPPEPVDRVLLVVGGRPPALPKQVGLVPGCPGAVDWREQLGTLRHRGVRVGVRAEPFAAPTTPGVPSGDRLRQYLSQAWQELAVTDGLHFRPGVDSAEQVALSLAAEQTRDTDGCPLAFAAPLLPPRQSDPTRS